MLKKGNYNGIIPQNELQTSAQKKTLTKCSPKKQHGVKKATIPG